MDMSEVQNNDNELLHSTSVDSEMPDEEDETETAAIDDDDEDDDDDTDTEPDSDDTDELDIQNYHSSNLDPGSSSHSIMNKFDTDPISSVTAPLGLGSDACDQVQAKNALLDTMQTLHSSASSLKMEEPGPEFKNCFENFDSRSSAKALVEMPQVKDMIQAAMAMEMPKNMPKDEVIKTEKTIKVEIESEDQKSDSSEQGMPDKEPKNENSSSSSEAMPQIKNIAQSVKATEKAKSPKSKGKCFQCEFCSRSFKRKDRLDVHMKLHTGDRPYICGVPDCFRSYTRLQHLQRHIERVHFGHDPSNIDGSKFECPDCHVLLANPECLKRHERRFHTLPLEGKVFECPEEGCNAVFRKKPQLISHREKDHAYNFPTANRLHVCPHEGCNKSFPYPTVLRRHMKVHQGYQCKLCGDVFESYLQLRKHKSVEHGPELFCQQCNSPFKSRQTLVQHLKTHLFVKEVFVCTEEGCERTFLYKKNLTQHIRAYHRGEKVFIKRKIPKEGGQKKSRKHNIGNSKTPAAKLSGIKDNGKKGPETPLDLTVSGKEEPHATSSIGTDLYASFPLYDYSDSSNEILDFQSMYQQTTGNISENKDCLSKDAAKDNSEGEKTLLV